MEKKVQVGIKGGGFKQHKGQAYTFYNITFSLICTPDLAIILVLFCYQPVPPVCLGDVGKPNAESASDYYSTAAPAIKNVKYVGLTPMLFICELSPFSDGSCA